MPDDRRDEAELKRLDRVKRTPSNVGSLLGPDMVSFFKQSVAKRQTRLAHIADAWQKLVPPILAEHCALEGLSRGTLSVIVDSSSHLYDLKQLLLAGLEKQITLACAKTGLRKIALKPGRWYSGESPADRKLRFG